MATASFRPAVLAVLAALGPGAHRDPGDASGHHGYAAGSVRDARGVRVRVDTRGESTPRFDQVFPVGGGAGSLPQELGIAARPDAPEGPTATAPTRARRCWTPARKCPRPRTSRSWTDTSSPAWSCSAPAARYRAREVQDRGVDALYAARWRPDGLWLFTRLYGPALAPDLRPGFSYCGDAVEFFADGVGTLRPDQMYGPHRRQFLFAAPPADEDGCARAAATTLGTNRTPSTIQVRSCARRTASGYNVEVGITGAELGFEPANAWSLGAGVTRVGLTWQLDVPTRRSTRWTARTVRADHGHVLGLLGGDAAVPDVRYVELLHAVARALNAAPPARRAPRA